MKCDITNKIDKTYLERRKSFIQKKCFYLTLYILCVKEFFIHPLYASLVPLS